MAKAFGFIIMFLAMVCHGFAQQQINITPEPAFTSLTNSYFNWNNRIVLYSNYSNHRAYEFLSKYLDDYYGLSFIVKPGNTNILLDPDHNSCIVLREKKGIHNPSFYSLIVTNKHILIEGSEEGIFDGVQTLLQLFPLNKENNNNIKIPGVSIIDSARFEYRGMHLDVSRHFFTTAQIKKYIDFLAYHKLNRFHWHLTDDQGWRIEIKKYPKLTELGSCRDQTLVGPYGTNIYDGKKYCGYYTQNEIRDIVQYASDRYITIIPEIDMPGHCVAALTAYPFLGCTKGPYEVMQTWGVSGESLCVGNDSTYEFVEDVLDEVMQLFPSTYIHIGGDECVKTRWKNCSRCLQKIKENKLVDENELQSFFVQRIGKYLEAKGRKVIGWDEILSPNLPAGIAIMSWRGETGGIAAAKQQHTVVMTPESPLYLNHSQSNNEDSVTQGGFNPLEDVYAYDPIPKGLNEQESKFILGAQGNLWSEYIDNEKKLEYMLFPRLAALSEVLWSPEQKRNWPAFETKLPGIIKRYHLWNVNYSNAYYDLQSTVIPSGENKIAWKLDIRNSKGNIAWKKDSSANVSFDYSSPVVIDGSGLYGAVLTDSSHKIAGNWLWQQFNINKATGRKVTLAIQPDKAYSFGGAFTLVDGIRNTKGMVKSIQFLGFWGNDLEALIDLGSNETFNSISLLSFEQPESWIYRPSSVSFYISNDGQHFQLIGNLGDGKGDRHIRYSMSVPAHARFVKIIARNYGKIPSGKPGGGNQAWLFADEIEIY